MAKPDLKLLRDCLVLDGKVDKKSFLRIINDCKKLSSKESNLVTREGEIVMIGDIHGQFYDMVSMLDELTPRLDQ